MSFVVETLGMLLLPLAVLVFTVPRERLGISRPSMAFLSLPLVWPLAIAAHAFAAKHRAEVVAVLVATGLGFLATVICLEAVGKYVAAPLTGSTSVGSRRWGFIWRLLLLWYVLSVVFSLAAFAVAQLSGFTEAGVVVEAFIATATLALAYVCARKSIHEEPHCQWRMVQANRLFEGGRSTAALYAAPGAAQRQR